MKLQLFSPPRLRLPDQQQDRRSTWLEAFYDLVFVVAITALSTRLGQARSVQGALQFIGLFLVVWWAWLGHTVYETRFDTNDLFQRLWTLGIMVSAAAMAVAIPRAFEGEERTFALAYVAARICLLILYARVWWTTQNARAIISVYLSGFGAGVLLWFVSLFVPAPYCYPFWSVGLLIEFITPWLGICILRRAPVDTTHLPERLGLFTLIILGEIVSVLVASISENHEGSVSLLIAVITFCIPACIWWAYFAFLEAAPFTPHLRSGQEYIYAHLPLYIGLTILGRGLGHVITDATHSGLRLSTRLLLGTGMLLWLIAKLLLKYISLQDRLTTLVFLRYGITMGAIILLMLVGDHLAPLFVVTLLALFTGIFAMLDTGQWKRWHEVEFH